MKARLALIAAAVVAVLGVGAQASDASTIASVSASCPEGVSVTLAGYAVDPAHASTVTVHFDGAVVANATFGTDYSFAMADPDVTVAHTYEVDVNPWSDADETIHTGTASIPACSPPVVPPPTTAPPALTPSPSPVATFGAPTPSAFRAATAVVQAPRFTG